MLKRNKNFEKKQLHFFLLLFLNKNLFHPNDQQKYCFEYYFSIQSIKHWDFLNDLNIFLNLQLN